MQGPNFDGHDFLEAAREQGAAAATVSRLQETALPLLEVDDTRLALGRLAANWRSRFALPVVAITGSNGKTTVRAMTDAILSRVGRTLSTRGNLNNDIGLPLTLARLSKDDRFAVIEMGANHHGEIDYLTRLARPTIAVVTNAGPAHLEGFGDLEGVARAKGEVFARLASGSTAVINADDRFAPLWRELAGAARVIDFGLEQPAAVQANWKGDVSGSRVLLKTPRGEVEIKLPVPGRHNVMNALAATAAALAAGADLETVRQGLESLTPVAGRFNVQHLPNGVTLIDDTYNANPESLQVALDVLAMAPGETWLVLGDMAELGTEAAALHREAGRRARRLGIDRVFGLGELARGAVDAFGDQGVAFDTLEALLAELHGLRHADLHILVKGSRGMRMERVVKALGGRVQNASIQPEPRR
ncbi:MAG: UDP-N-acetylmuramoyl-tripeptide--D-alanyl-D-alanine ligase [Halobacteria archaeon]|nr:UDP-N-acetylmuramoyl-tripeptide--D-alanyl-D-alanine ligase [Halobacteria archaeon]